MRKQQPEELKKGPPGPGEEQCKGPEAGAGLVCSGGGRPMRPERSGLGEEQGRHHGWAVHWEECAQQPSGKGCDPADVLKASRPGG